MSSEAEDRIIEIMQSCNIIEYRIRTTICMENDKSTLFDVLEVLLEGSSDDKYSWATANEFVNPTRKLLKELERLTMGEES